MGKFSFGKLAEVAIERPDWILGSKTDYTDTFQEVATGEVSDIHSVEDVIAEFLMDAADIRYVKNLSANMQLRNKHQDLLSRFVNEEGRPFPSSQSSNKAMEKVAKEIMERLLEGRPVFLKAEQKTAGDRKVMEPIDFDLGKEKAAVPKPGAFKRFLNHFGFFKKEVEAYDDYEKNLKAREKLTNLRNQYNSAVRDVANSMDTETRRRVQIVEREAITPEEAAAQRKAARQADLQERAEKLEETRKALALRGQLDLNKNKGKGMN